MSAVVINSRTEEVPEYENSKKIGIAVKEDAGVRVDDTLEYNLVIEDSIGNKVTLPGTVFIDRDPV